MLNRNEVLVALLVHLVRPCVSYLHLIPFQNPQSANTLLVPKLTQLRNVSSERQPREWIRFLVVALRQILQKQGRRGGGGAGGQFASGSKQPHN